MKLGIAQRVIAVTIIVLAMLTQLAPPLEWMGGGRRPDPSEASIFGPSFRALAQDDDNEDNDEDNDDDNEDDDNEDEDNEDEDNDDDNEDDDNEDEDNEDEDNDEEDNEGEDNDDGDNEDDDNEDDEDIVIDNIDADVFDEIVAAGDDATFVFDASVTEATGTTTGGDDRIGLPADRVLVQSYPWMPRGVSLTIRLTAPPVALAPCMLVGDLVFQLEGRDAYGTALTQLPAEVNLSARYTYQQAIGVNRRAATLVWLDPTDQQWKPAPKVVTSPDTNYVAASVMALGTYAVCAP